MSRFILAVSTALLAIVFVTPNASARAFRHKTSREGNCQAHVGGYFGQLGYCYYGALGAPRYPFVNGSAYNYPGYLNNQFFWERVVTQRNYPVQY